MNTEVECLLTVDQAGELLGVSPYTIRSWIRSGKIRPTRLGRLVRIEKAELKRFIESGKSPTQ
jgi:excisionase family DNA binding protein